MYYMTWLMCGLIGELETSSIHGLIQQFEATHITGNASTKHGQHQQATKIPPRQTHQGSTSFVELYSDELKGKHIVSIS